MPMSKQTCHLDFETFNDRDLRKTGVHAYSESPYAGIYVLRWRLIDEENKWIVAEGDWRPGADDPLELLAHVESGGKVVAHNAIFERTTWNLVLRRDFPHWPPLKIEQQDCTMARAAALALPQGLDMLASVLRTPVQKDKEGYALMLRMCRPRGFDNGVPIFDRDPEHIERLSRYCGVDVDTECVVDEALPRLSAEERRVWELDQRINDRGVLIDERAVQRAGDVAHEAIKRANERMWYLTDGDVQKVTQTRAIVEWLNKRGIPCESVAKGEHEELIAGAELYGDTDAQEVVALRRAAGKASTAKYRAMRESVSRDGRCKGMLNYHGAGPGRWAGRLVQPQNFPRVDPDRDLPRVETLHEFLETRMSAREIVDSLEMLGIEPLETLSKALRSMFIAGPGNRLVGGDYSNIEGRLNAWISGEAWKLQAFREYDAGIGPDLYLLSYSRSFGTPVAEVSKPQRQIGKVQELALGYQGSVGAYLNMAANYFIKPHDVAKVAREAVSDEQWRAAEDKYGSRNTYGLDRFDWCGLFVTVSNWRAAHPDLVQGWWDLQDAAIAAVGSPGTKHFAYDGKAAYIAANGFLFCQLPSKRVIAYASPRLIETDPDGRRKLQIEYDAVDSVTKQWGPQRLYGGLQCNNVVQGTARDVMVNGMFAAEGAGYPLILTVHDELLAEVSESFGSVEEFRSLMLSPVPWLQGCPLSAAAWEAKRYVK